MEAPPDLHRLESLIALTPDWPQPGVLFRDIAPLLAQDFTGVIDALAAVLDPAACNAADAFAGIDARGFIFAAALAQRAGKNMLMIRKDGKLPPPVETIDYALEYGAARLALKPGTGRVMIIDDVLATGGTMMAAADLCARAGYQVTGFGALIDLRFLNDFEWHGMRVRSVFSYD